MNDYAGQSNALYYVAFVDRGEVRRVVSLRYAERKEIKHYVENYPQAHHSDAFGRGERKNRRRSQGRS